MSDYDEVDVAKHPIMMHATDQQLYISATNPKAPIQLAVVELQTGMTRVATKINTVETYGKGYHMQLDDVSLLQLFGFAFHEFELSLLVSELIDDENADGYTRIANALKRVVADLFYSCFEYNPLFKLHISNLEWTVTQEDSCVYRHTVNVKVRMLVHEDHISHFIENATNVQITNFHQLIHRSAAQQRMTCECVQQLVVYNYDFC